MCLLLGATGVGKTLLMKRLEHLSSAISKHGNDYSFMEVPATIPTVGTNLVNVNVNRRQDITVRELGGCMGPIWKNYFKDCTALLYMIDISNRLQVAAACIQLLSILSSDKFASVPVLIIFNKIDMPEKMSISEIDSLFRLNEIKSNYTSLLQCVEISACTGKGIGEVIRWLEQIYQGK